MSSEEATSDNLNEGQEATRAEEKTESTKPEEVEDSTERNARPPTSRRDDPPPSTKLYVGNLPDMCKRSELTDLFEKFGTIEKCDVLRNFAFVHFEKPEDAEKAVEKLDDSEFMGVHIQVQKARSKGKPTAGENECFECGREGHWARDCQFRRRGRGRGPPFRSGYRGPDNYRGPDSYRGYRDQYRDGYNDYSYGRYAGPSRYGGYGDSSYGGSPYSSYGSRPRSRSPPRSYHSAYAYPPRR